MAKLIFRLNSVPDDEAEDVRNLLTEHKIDFYESPPGNWGISMHGLWLNDESQTERAKKIIDEYQRERYETQKNEDVESLLQRILRHPVQSLVLLAFILFVLYVSVVPFWEIGQG